MFLKQHKMNKKLCLGAVMAMTLLMISCSNNYEADKAGIDKTEHDFAVMADRDGIAEAFYFFAADSAVILRGGKLIRGREAIKEYYSTNLKPGTRLLWAPDFVEVSGDLGYTYGRYTHLVPDSTGSMKESHGYFHTVWQRQPDGSWRFVWD
jgi:ketosteroid isomerase-like protein